MDFDQMLAKYRFSLLEYKVTGQTPYKTAANEAERWLRDYISTLNTSVQSDAAYIRRFIKEYESTNPDLIKFQKDIQEARKKGPELSDIYEGQQKILPEEPEVDEWLFYTKVAAVGGIFALAAVAAFV
jgi:hypothetical protein